MSESREAQRSEIVAEVDARTEVLAKQVDRLEQIYRRVMRRGIDYDVLPGTRKPSLKKEGAELLAAGLQYYPESTIVRVEENTDPSHPFFLYAVKCTLYDKLTGRVAGDAVGAANSAEVQFALKWIPEAAVPEGVKTYGERQLYGTKQVRVQLEPWEVFSLQNKVLKMADKRAFVAAVLRVTGASRIFTQDMEDEAMQQQEQSATPTTMKTDAAPPPTSAPPTEGEQKPRGTKATKMQVDYLHGLVKRSELANNIATAFLEYRGLKEFSELSKEEASILIEDLKGTG